MMICAMVRWQQRRVSGRKAGGGINLLYAIYALSMDPTQRCIVNILLLRNRALYIFLDQPSGDRGHWTYADIKAVL